MLSLLLGCAPNPPDPFGGDFIGWLTARGCERPPSDECLDHDCQSPDPECFPVRVTGDCTEPYDEEMDVFVTTAVLDEAEDVCGSGRWAFQKFGWWEPEGHRCYPEELDDDDPTPTWIVWCYRPNYIM